ncbi:MAG TPA: cyclic peptide export ABC transporter [Pyrinomonadaceae bacterium]|nr:cyclic peptide export ABC transporter [Pyrinomonadaceae bacterium]
MKLLLFLLRNSRGILILAVIAGVISGASNTGLLAVITAGLGNSYSRNTLIAAFVALCIVAPLSRIASEVLLVQLGQKAVFDLRMKLSAQILRVPLRQLEELGPHKLTVALTDDVMSISNAIILVPILFINVAVVAGCLIYLSWLSWAAFIAVLGFIIVGTATYQLPIIAASRSFRNAREEEDSLFRHFHALVEGIKELKIHNRRQEEFLNRELQSTATSFRRHSVKGMAIYSVAASWGQLLVFIVIALLIFVLPGMASTSSLALTGFALTILYMMTPLQVVMNTLPALGRASVALNKVETLGLSLQAQATDVAAAADDQKLRFESLQFSDVRHSYYLEGEAHNFTLGPVDLTFKSGEVVFIVGGNGSGKTTLAKLLIGLYSPESGEIRLNGELITDEKREFYRQYFSVVFADFYLFETLLGLDSPELDTKARDYLKRLQLEQRVKIEGTKFSTTKLSHGQRKRLALLTAYLEDRPVYLFDEWAADQDPLFKEIFYLQLLPELKARGKTVFVISHDDHYYFVGDRIIKLDYGKIEYDQTEIEAPAVAELPLARE